MDSSNNSTIAKKTHSYSSIVKSKPKKTADKSTDTIDTTDILPETTDKLPETTDKLPETTDKLPETTDKLPETTDKLPETTDKLPEATDTTDKLPETTDTTDKLPETTDKPQETADKPQETADKPLETADKPLETADKPLETKRYAKTSTQKPINDKITFTEKNNSRNNNIDYKTALINASNIFLSECTLSNTDFIEKEKAKIAKFRQNYAPTVVHKVSYDKNFDAQQIGTQTIIFSRNQFAHNEMFRRKIGNIYKEMFDCDWVKIKDSTRETEPNTLLISIGMNN